MMKWWEEGREVRDKWEAGAAAGNILRKKVKQKEEHLLCVEKQARSGSKNRHKLR